jgi:molybdopterin synthase catalytic subunit
MVELTNEAIDVAKLLSDVGSTQAGAVLLFLGTTREFTHGKQTTTLDYEAYNEMAEKKLAQLEATARKRWQLVDCGITHRLGNVPLGDASVAIAVSSSHRRTAFEAGRWLIDTLKAEVPIWKCEHWADGTSEWVHPE